ncbi:bifunctional 2-polyprenyl-6-hydroxyphenol methylase/3-demethylubiquinol 3-O-methyltransferase UbiG [Propioniciclava sp. MC1595]|uniref:class I SAM-dependent methyltransferase n=1 Tax=Propioniciclava sp. MC1595 TaxID=2760308 RepID=UPI001FB75C4D|nr:class I SAM-dependent methyltransferase [Propioniciclava sp. MC1595]
MSEQEWDERYASSERMWSGRPNPALVAEVADLAPGTVLDVGCGEGADAVWLAQRGWTVTGLDISGVALDRARAWAAEQGVEATWVKSGLLEADLAPGSFDLVAVLYPPLPRTEDATFERALADLVAPGGHLLVVHHAPPREGEVHHGPGHGHHGDDSGESHRPDFAAMVAPASVLPVLGDGWAVETDAVRERSVEGGAGAHHLEDLVLRARRVG